ncbi:MAG: hypothetical protein mread185_000313 [Mycoplasmataceae bacterium]|nr:MAG: hypothetical protein mread185_000313 [Mycoplasmataceae bacterium]
MKKKIIYWLDWKKKIVTSNNSTKSLSLKELENYPITVYCDANTFAWLQAFQGYKQDEKGNIAIGKAIIKEKRGGDENNSEGEGTQALKLLHKLVPSFSAEHPNSSPEFFELAKKWKISPRFENLQQGIFKDVWYIDIKSCYPKIMKEYPLPCGEPEHLQDPQLIEKSLWEKKKGFVKFYCENYAEIKNQQIPFIPDSDYEYEDKMKSVIKGRKRIFLYTRLFEAFKKNYKIKGRLIYTDFWVFSEKKGCANKFLDYCQELRNSGDKKGKSLANSLWGALGKKGHVGYNYYPWHLAVSHLALLKTYHLYRNFQPQNIIEIRSDAIYVKEKIPTKLMEQEDAYTFKFSTKFGFGQREIFNYETGEIKSPLSSERREESIKKWLNKNQTN